MKVSKIHLYSLSKQKGYFHRIFLITFPLLLRMNITKKKKKKEVHLIEMFWGGVSCMSH